MQGMFTICEIIEKLCSIPENLSIFLNILENKFLFKVIRKTLNSTSTHLRHSNSSRSSKITLT
jgi:hypothetical protein